MHKITIENLTKYYGDNLVLDDVDLAVSEHEVVCLIGASGSGKSTLLRCVNDLVPFDAGVIKLDGIPIHDAQFAKRELYKRIGIVFQAYNLFPHMNVIENITLAPVRVHRAERASAVAYAHELLGMFGLDGYAESYPEQLSGGQQQRVAIVRALATRPDVLMLDEVTAALDPELIGGVLAVIRDLKDQGMTMLIVTHEMGFARDVASSSPHRRTPARSSFCSGSSRREDSEAQLRNGSPRLTFVPRITTLSMKSVFGAG